MAYFYVFWADDETVAYAPSEFEDLPGEGTVSVWSPCRFRLTGHWSDYLGNDVGVRLCSDRMRKVLEDSRAAQDDVQWLPCSVGEGDDERDYWLLHLPSGVDALDRARSTFTEEGEPIKRVLDCQAVAGRKVFTWLNGASMALIISEEVKLALESEGVTGVKFSRLASTQ